MHIFVAEVKYHTFFKLFFQAILIISRFYLLMVRYSFVPTKIPSLEFSLISYLID